MAFKDSGKKIYNLIKENKVLASVCFLCYQTLKKIRYKECRSDIYPRKPSWQGNTIKVKDDLREIKMAVICDEMTFKNLKPECKVVALTPANWKKRLCSERPDVFFCESAWLGLEEYNNCWHGKIYRNHMLLFENRSELFKILKFCKKYRIPTIFWNKEDPTFFESKYYDFKDTALKFDWIFTTAIECVEEYQKLGHIKTGVMMFGFSPYMFNPLNSKQKEKRAVFAGSWYEEDKTRCITMERIFDKVLNQNIPLVIYDRQSNNSKVGRAYPSKYRPFIRNAIPLEQLGKELKQARYAININTVTESETMFARRVFELMAMNIMVISNRSIGMHKLFANRVWFQGERWSEEHIDEICKKNREEVFQFHTNKKRLTEIFIKLGLLREKVKNKIAVVISDDKKLSDFQGDSYIAVSYFYSNLKANMKHDYQYGIFYDGKLTQPDFEKYLMNFCYLPSDCGIKITGNDDLRITEDTDNENVLFPWYIFREVMKQNNYKTKKFLMGE